MAGIVRKVAAGISERFASTWVLLSDTTNFLSRTSAFSQYEAELMDFRRRLSSSRRDEEGVHKVRAELVELRKALRLVGYDLTLGALELEVKGFRNDAALAEGFRRMALFIGLRSIWAISGDENHRALHDSLDRECARRGIGDVIQKHYLWYRWTHGLLTVSGSDSETAVDFEGFRLWCEVPENRLLILSRLRGNR